MLAIGEVAESGYEFRPDLEYPHTVHVKWDTSYSTDIPTQKRWAFVTVAKVPSDLYETILGKKSGGETKSVPVDSLYTEMAAALERKRQVILYGPPGTGKTFHSRRLAVWWLLHSAGNQDAAAILADPQRFSEAERALSTVQVNRRVWYVVANPKEWTWDRLKKDRKTEYRYGRLQRT